MYCAEINIHSLPCTVTYRRERSVREVYEERFLSDRPVSVCEKQPSSLETFVHSNAGTIAYWSFNTVVLNTTANT